VTELASDHQAVVGVDTGEGVLGLLSIQLEGKRAISAAEFLRGQRDFMGDTLGAETGG
jgi:methionyl-tRNA formyltransferase